MALQRKSVSVGIDVGGTHTRVALIDQQKTILTRRRETTDRTATASSWCDQLADVIRDVMRQGSCDAPISSIGLALPGTLDADRRSVIRSIRLPFLEDVPVVDELERRVGVTPLLCTDAEASTWGEYIAWPVRCRCFVHLRLGTGTALGVVIDGRLIRLDTDRRSHLAVLIVNHKSDAPLCSCGQRGCLETIASGPAVEERAKKLFRKRSAGLSPRGRKKPEIAPRRDSEMVLHQQCLFNGIVCLQQAWEQSDDRARVLVQSVADALRVAVENLNDHYQPDVIVIGGGLVDHLPCLSTILLQDKRLQPARLGDDAGLIGAGRFGFEIEN